jgi:HEAT repeat protein
MTDPRVAPLLGDLRGRYAVPRKKAADALVVIGAPAVPALIDTLNHKLPEAQQAAADALTRIGTPDALAAVDAWKARSQQGS